jgi:hypothetical protein
MCFNSFDTLIGETESALGRNFCFLMHLLCARDIQIQSLTLQVNFRKEDNFYLISIERIIKYLI